MEAVGRRHAVEAEAAPERGVARDLKVVERVVAQKRVVGGAGEHSGRDDQEERERQPGDTTLHQAAGRLWMTARSSSPSARHACITIDAGTAWLSTARP